MNFSDMTFEVSQAPGPLASCYMVIAQEDLQYEISDGWSYTSRPNEIDFPGHRLFAYDYEGNTTTFYLKNEKERGVVRMHFGHGSIVLTAWSYSVEKAGEVIKTARKTFPPTKPTAKAVIAHFWQTTSMGAQASAREIDVPKWSEIESNYPAETRSAFSQLIATTPDPAYGGKLVLLYGEPGTGKSWAIRSIAKTWQSWADLHIVLDPEAFFGSADYMMSVLLSRSRGTSPWASVDDDEVEYDDDGLRVEAEKKVERWRVVVLEDAGELIGADAKTRTGQGMARLLNICDGLVGQGLRTIILITTNEPIDVLHPAVTRPGRCLAQIEFDKFTSETAARWLADHSEMADKPIVKDGMTLAELYEAVHKTKLVNIKKTSKVGFRAD